MANTRKVLLSLHNEVADALATEKAKGNNMSAVVDAVLAAHYGLSFEGGSVASSSRQSILDSLKAGTPTTEAENQTPVVNDTEVAAAAETVSSTNVQDVTPTETTVEPVIEPVAPQGGEVQPSTDTNPGFVPVSAPAGDGFTPMVQPLGNVEPTSEVQSAEPQAPEAAADVILPDVTLTATAEVTPAAPTSMAEALASESEDSEVLNDTDETIEDDSETETTTEFAPGTKVCPTCGEPMVTPICLNCL